MPRPNATYLEWFYMKINWTIYYPNAAVGYPFWNLTSSRIRIECENIDYWTWTILSSPLKIEQYILLFVRKQIGEKKMLRDSLFAGIILLSNDVVQWISMYRNDNVGFGWSLNSFTVQNFPCSFSLSDALSDEYIIRMSFGWLFGKIRMNWLLSFLHFYRCQSKSFQIVFLSFFQN